MSRILPYLFLLLPLFLFPAASRAQVYNPEIEAYIALHKKTGVAFDAHTLVEKVNVKAHEGNMDAAALVRQQADSLGFYYKAFNWVDLAYSSLKFAFNVSNTMSLARKRIEGIVSLLDQYRTAVLMHGAISREDREIFEIGEKLYGDIRNDVRDIEYTAGTIAGYVSLQFPCTTYSMLQQLKKLNDSLEHIQHTLNMAYNSLYRFMLMRLGWHWHSAYVPVDRVSVAEGAIGRWRNSTIESLNRSAAVGLDE